MYPSAKHSEVSKEWPYRICRTKIVEYLAKVSAKFQELSLFLIESQNIENQVTSALFVLMTFL